MIWRLEVHVDGSAFDVMLDADLESSTKDFRAELERLGVHRTPVTVDGVEIDSVDTIGELPLRHGSIIDCRASAGDDVRRRQTTEIGHHLVVLFGPDAGDCWPLGIGRFTLGRSGGNDIRVADPLMSGHHAAVVVQQDGVVRLEDLGSTNGTFAEGELVDGSLTVEPGTYFQIGSSVLAVVDVAAADLAVISDAPGADTALQRRFRQAEEPLPKRLTPPSEPSGDEGAGSTWWRSLMPLVTGAGFAMLTGRWQFLLIMALAPIMFTVDIVRKKRKKKAKVEADRAQYELDRARFDRSVADLRTEERRRRRSAAIGGGLGTLLAVVRHRRLWERTPSDPDFANVTIGLAALPSEIDAGDGDEVDGGPRPWGAPLESSLLTTGSLGLLGPQTRTQAVLRGMTIGLAAAHSPADVRLWLFSDEAHGDDWTFARWLPHTFAGPRTSTLAFHRPDRASLLKSLKQELDTRIENDGGNEGKGPVLPLHVAVFDRADLVAEADLADLLLRGPAVGIVGIVADPMVTPEGVMGTLTLGQAADDAVFESREQPRVAEVRTAEMDPTWAEEAARHLAFLRPTTDDQSGGGMNGVVHLTDLLALDGLTPADLVERWERMSPQTAATIGLASDTPMVMDIAEHGPHGLVGGMSGSGKTEFLMTLLTSLCLNNHPDDLAIVIVDFKGGVDHALTSQLPHVVGLSTNLHIEQFKRTIDLLDAEQRRRQALLAGVGGDLDAYRTARLTRPELPPLPRLLVIVDEFSELLASDDGKQRLQELVRVTRIGRALGVHLLLVTQNFEGQLPPQVEANAGLRVCLRVMKPSHSKVVLDSGIASTIPDTRIGRAYARLNGRDLVEFQTARVAGRRRDLASGPPPVELLRTPVDTLCRTAAQRREGKPPTEETDMHALIGTTWDAVRHSGWTASAVPWPDELPAAPSLRDLLVDWKPEAGTAPIGVQDRPEEQRHATLALTPADEQILLLGGPTAALGDAMVTMATSMAVLHSPDELHVHGIDLDGSGLARLRGLPHCGTVATRDETLGLQLLKYLTNEVAERRAAMVAAGTTSLADLAVADPSGSYPEITLFVSGADRLVRRGDDTRSQLLAPLVSLVAESIGTGVRIVLAGLPNIADSRLGANVERRFVFKMPGDVSPSSYGAPRELAADLDGSGRCVDTNAKLLTQMATVSGSAEEIGARLRSTHPEATIGRAPKTFVTVTWPYPISNVGLERLERPADFVLPVPIAVDTESGEVAWVDGEEDGPVFAVAGGPKSGRSMTLVSIATMAKAVGWATVGIPGSRRSPLAALDGTPDSPFDLICPARRLAANLDQVPAERPLLLLFDDLHRIDADELDLSGVFDPGRATAAFIAASPDYLTGRDDTLRLFPPVRSGILVAPSGFADGGAIGLSGRLSDEQRANPRAGRGLLAVAGEAREVQVPSPLS